MADKTVKVALTASVDGYVSELGRAAQATLNTEKAAQSAGQRIQSSLGKGLATSVKAGAAAFTAATAAVVGFGVSAMKAGAAYNGMQQASRAALTTILGGAKAANAQMDKLDEFASKSPFAKQVFIQAQQQLLGFGVAADRVIPTLDAIQNSVAAVGGSNDDIANVTDALAKMMGSGKLAGDTLNRLGLYGIDAASIIGESMGKTGAEIRTMASKPGGIPADQVFDVLVNGLQKKFGGAADNVKKTWVGATDRIKGAVRDIGSDLARAFVTPTGGGMAIEWVNKYADLLRALQKQIRPISEELLPRMGGALSGVTPLLERATAAVKRFDARNMGTELDRVSAAAPGLAAASASLLAMGGNSLGLKKIGLALNPVAAGLVALVTASPEARKAVLDLLDALSPLVPVAAELALVLSTGVSGAVGAVGSLVQAATPLVEGLAKGVGLLADGFGMLPGPVQTTLVLFGALRIAMQFDRFQKMTDSVLGTSRAFTDSVGSLRGSIGAWRDLSRELQVANPALSGMQSRVMALTTGGGALGKMSNAFMDAAVQAKRFPTAAGLAAASMSGMKSAASGVLGVLGGPWGIAVAGATMAITGWMQAQENARQAARALADTLDRQTGSFTRQTRDSVTASLLKDFAPEDWAVFNSSLNAAKVGIADFIKAYEDGPEAIAAFKARFDQWQESANAAAKGDEHRQNTIKALGSTYAATGRDMEGALAISGQTVEINKQLGDSEAEKAEKAKASAQAIIDAIPPAKTYQDHLKDLSAASKGLRDLQQDLARAVLAASDAYVDAEAAGDKYKSTLQGAWEALKKNGRTLNDNTEAGRANRAVLRDLRDSAMATWEANLKQGDGIDKVTGQMEKAREEFIKVATQMNGGNRKAAEELADKYDFTKERVKGLHEAMKEIPKEVKSEVEADISGAKSKIDEIKRLLAEIRETQIRVNVATNTGLRGQRLGPQYQTARADGGPLPGHSPTDRADDHLFLGTAGEWVIRRASVRKLERDQPGALDWINRYGTIPRYADGGPIGRIPASMLMSPVAPIDYGRLGREFADRMPPMVSVYSGKDAKQAADDAISDWMWRRDG